MRKTFVNNILSRIIIVSIVVSFASVAGGQTSMKPADKFARTLEYVKRFYVDSVNSGKLVEDAIVNMLEELDPHSSYMTAEEVKEMNEPLQGNFEGIGVSFNILNDTILIIQPVPGGPSEKLGIMAGDKIIRINNENVAGTGITNKGVFDRLRGPKGTVVSISIKRTGTKGLLDYSITRDKIPINSLDAAYMIDKGVGYIKLNRFAATTTREFLTALDQLKHTKSKHGEKMNSLILDLSGNGGGYLEEAINLADQFLSSGKLILYTEGLNSPKMEFDATGAGEFEKGNLIVIIDESTASASEIVSGALQDWDRAIIVGRRSFGKGLVQRPFPLPDGSMIRLTIARYYTPTGRLIQKSYKKGYKDYENDLISRYNHGEFISADSIHFADSLKYYTLEKHKVVYGGGGIMPDIFVPLDTTSYSDFYRDLIRKGTLNRFILGYVDQNRKILNKNYPDFPAFRDKFSVTDPIFNQLLEYGKKDNLTASQKDLEASGTQIKLLIKAYIARDLWNSSEFFEIYNTDDKTVQKAVYVMKNWSKFNH